MLFRSKYFAAELKSLAAMQDDGLLQVDADRIVVRPRGRLLIRSIAMTFDRYLRERSSAARFSRLI